MKIAIDIDDTICDTTNFFLEQALIFDSENGGTGIKDEQLQFPACFKWNIDLFRKFYSEIFSKHYLEIPLLKDADIVINKLHDDGNKIIFVTARNYDEFCDPLKICKNYLDKYHIKYDDIIVNAKNKGPIILEQNIDILIDDSPRHCFYVADNSDKKVIMLATNRNNIKHDNIIRLNNWIDIFRYIENEREF